MALIAALCFCVYLAIFAGLGFLLNTLYLVLFKGKEEEIFGPKVGIFYFLHGLSLGPFIIVSIVLLSLLVSLRVLLGELTWLALF